MHPGRLLVVILLGAIGCRSGGASGARDSRVGASGEPAEIRPLASGERGFALHVGKLLTMNERDEIFDPGMVIVRGGKIEFVGAPLEVPEGYERVDMDECWVWPGMVDLHSHIHSGGFGDVNDMVKPFNPSLSSSPAVRPGNPLVRTACASGVTTLFGIPGSGTSISGFGVLYKTKPEGTYEASVLKDPGGMKSAYNFNPQRAGGDLGAGWSGLTWMTRDLLDLALAAKRDGRADPELVNLIKVLSGELPVLIHTASAEGVAGTARLWRRQYQTESVLSHGDWDGHLAAKYVADSGMPVNHGPRILNFNSFIREEKVLSTGQEFIAAGVPNFSLNTDASVIPQEELFLQGSITARLGADAYTMLRALTIHPAKSFMIGDRVGSLEPGKDADLVVTTGDPLDPRSRVEMVFIDGDLQYSRQRDGQWY